jgi:hypothetical protein
VVLIKDQVKILEVVIMTTGKNTGVADNSFISPAFGGMVSPWLWYIGWVRGAELHPKIKFSREYI